MTGIGTVTTTLAAGVAVYLVTAFVKRSHWPSDVNLLVALVVAGAVSLGVVLGEDVWGGTRLDWAHWRDYAAGPQRRLIPHASEQKELTVTATPAPTLSNN
jgi:hypothetical protein